MKDLNGWTHIGNYGSAYLYAKGNERRLVDAETGQTTFRYWVPSGQGYSTTKKLKGAKSKVR